MLGAAAGALGDMELWPLETGKQSRQETGEPHLASKTASHVVYLKSGVLHRLISVSDPRNCVFQGLGNSLVSLPLVCCA